ncbi:diaminopimelate decarboxylase [Clostridium tagluense]|uniref:diaminopimelate decarboxylase n=1 Tax=Clostridium TaxID=1485 RepID=UPI0013E972E9|nr:MULTISPECIES: diaminopimelate decarboxylase [Clostridium]MBU3126978.1 diaminopimelate decarboxylase [Clostridium tagluense]MBW9155545.1 diaminopimelate decarboxylase [Clostridium tagluense]MBZ9625361.1 diaminopimelate decarboxylase [Clostridium sp. FP2]MCB2310979.1 diaminopimelate decarboxylase [Clostridium tagluense]MCB2316837.1 diaminopimelate decarboxylase [Clostridium tagluense]
MRFFGNIVDENNKLNIAGVSAQALAKEYGTPLYVMDEQLIRGNCRRFSKAFEGQEDGNKVAYAGKAFLTMAMCEIVKSEGLYLDVVSGGELYTAYKADFPLRKVYFHGNNKTLDEIEMAIELGVGTFVVDNLHEMEIIHKKAMGKGIMQRVLLRVTPGIEAHTHEYIKTGQIDSKFGFTALNNELEGVIKTALNFSNIKLAGLHCHIGSQIFELQPYRDAVGIMLSFIKDIKEKFSYDIEELDLGGGFGVYYNKGDEPKEIEDFCRVIIQEAKIKCKEYGIKSPTLVIEPGRSIVANAGITLYTVGAIKDIPNVRKYVAVDGGMTDNIRPALYNAEYQCVLANRINEPCMEVVTIAGKCCESGDILLEGVRLPVVDTGDLMAVLSTGAYGYSMSSNYNKIRKAAVVLVSEGKHRLICKRQTYKDMISNEVCL